MRQTKSKQITKAFRVDARAWANFEKAAKSYRATPAELLREFVGHTDAAMKGVESGRIRSFDGDVSQLIKTEFPQLSSFQLRVMSEVLMQASKLGDKEREK
jgi:hypothetical protein